MDVTIHRHIHHHELVLPMKKNSDVTDAQEEEEETIVLKPLEFKERVMMMSRIHLGFCF
jgi:hypothetical protein